MFHHPRKYLLWCPIGNSLLSDRKFGQGFVSNFFPVYDDSKISEFKLDFTSLSISNFGSAPFYWSFCSSGTHLSQMKFLCRDKFCSRQKKLKHWNKGAEASTTMCMVKILQVRTSGIEFFWTLLSIQKETNA